MGQRDAPASNWIQDKKAFFLEAVLCSGPTSGLPEFRAAFPTLWASGNPHPHPARYRRVNPGGSTAETVAIPLPQEARAGTQNTWPHPKKQAPWLNAHRPGRPALASQEAGRGHRPTSWQQSDCLLAPGGPRTVHPPQPDPRLGQLAYLPRLKGCLLLPPLGPRSQPVCS